MQINVRLLSFSLHGALEEVLYGGNSGERKFAESPFQFQEATIVHPQEADLASLPASLRGRPGGNGINKTLAEACGSRTHHSTREGPNRRL
jgi:hypothetical protein